MKIVHRRGHLGEIKWNMKFPVCRRIFDIYSQELLRIFRWQISFTLHGHAETWNFFSTWYLTQLLCSLMRYQIEHLNRNSITPCNHLLFCLPYKHITCNKKPTEFTYKKRTPCHLFMALNKASNMPAAVLQHVKNYRTFFMCGDTLFLGGGNPYKAL